MASHRPLSSLFTDWSLDTLGLSVLIAEVGTDNPASSAVAERAGYRRLLERPDGTVVYEKRGTERAAGACC